MNYYEELGLSANASADEIRQAYKSVAKLLHPDRQSEADLRKMAELQMTRLNNILATLSDPALRARYDASLRAPTNGHTPGIEVGPPPRVYIKLRPFRTGKVRPRAGAIIWSIILMAAASGFAFVFLYFEHDSGMVVYQPAEETGRQTPAPAKDPVQVTPAPLTSTAPVLPAPRSSSTELARPVRRDEQLTRHPQTPTSQDPEPAQPMAALASNPAPDSGTVPSRTVADPLQRSGVQVATTAAPSTPSAVVASAKPAPTSRDRLVGTWLYVKPQTQEEGIKNFSYRPEYIELVIKPGQQGKIFGTYKGQFHVPDRPISSEVILRFEGPAAGGTNDFFWRGDDGASGQIRVKMVSDGVIDVSWYTTRFGSAQKLASGTAVLYRD